MGHLSKGFIKVLLLNLRGRSSTAGKRTGLNRIFSIFLDCANVTSWCGCFVGGFKCVAM